MRGARRHHLDALARGEPAVLDPDVGDHAAVGVVDGVEDHRADRAVRPAFGRGDLGDDPVEQLGHPRAGLARHREAFAGVDADERGELLRVLLGLGRGEVDLVEHGDDREVVVEGHVEVGQGLRLDPLGRVDEEDRPLARGERAVDLVGEVDVPGRVDHVEGVGLARDGPGEADGLGFDRDPPFAFDVHAVQVLVSHDAFVDDPGQLQHAVGQRGLSVVDVGDDAEIADARGRGGRGTDLWRQTGG